MKIDKNFAKATLVFAVGLTAGTVALSMFVNENVMYLLGNSDKIDTEKQFNVLIEPNGDNVSLVLVQNYYDNSGSTVQILTQDGLGIITSLRDAQLLNISSYEEAYNYACQIVKDADVVSYDSLQGLDLDDINQIGYKRYLGRNYNYQYAIVLEDQQANIYEVDTYRHWEDDKIQFTTLEGDVLLKDVDNVKFVGCENVDKDSVYAYAESLVGNADNIHEISSKVYQKTK